MIAVVVPIDLSLKSKSISSKEEMKLGEMQQRMKPGNFFSVTGEVIVIERTEGRWTVRLIPNLREWIDYQRGGEVNYNLIQFLSGHDNFNAFLCRMKKVKTSTCQYGDSLLIKMFCNLFQVQQIYEREEALEMELGEFTPKCVVNIMLCSRRNGTPFLHSFSWFSKKKKDRPKG